MTEMTVAGKFEPRAGYYVSTQDRPAFVSAIDDDAFDDVFELMRQEQDGSSEAFDENHRRKER
jgi:hypothetical protein